jgi:hypothetical protein
MSNRKIIQIHSTQTSGFLGMGGGDLIVLALCDDGTLWGLNAASNDPKKKEWQQMNCDLITKSQSRPTNAEK